MIKITERIIEIDKEQFKEKVIDLCGDLHTYLNYGCLTVNSFNLYFKTKLNALEFAKLMDDNYFEIELSKTTGEVLVDIKKLLKGLK